MVVQQKIVGRGGRGLRRRRRCRRGGRRGRRRRQRRRKPNVANGQVCFADVHDRVIQRPGLEESVAHKLEERYDDEREHALDERERFGKPLERF